MGRTAWATVEKEYSFSAFCSSMDAILCSVWPDLVGSEMCAASAAR
jgi:hypothetical protein